MINSLQVLEDNINALCKFRNTYTTCDSGADKIIVLTQVIAAQLELYEVMKGEE